MAADDTPLKAIKSKENGVRHNKKDATPRGVGFPVILDEKVGIRIRTNQQKIRNQKLTKSLRGISLSLGASRLQVETFKLLVCQGDLSGSKE